MLLYVVIGVAALLVGAGLRHLWGVYRGDSAEKRGEKVIAESKIEAERLIKEVEVKNKQTLLAAREQLESEIREERNELKTLEKRLTKREDNLDKKVELLDKKEAQQRETENRLLQRERALQARDLEITKILDQQRDRLHEIARMSVEDARTEVLKRAEIEMEKEVLTIVNRAQNRAQEQADEKARWLIGQAMCRLAADYTTEHVVSTVEVPSEDMKGRIIGREGRNIRAFENATGVDVIVDDTPGVIVLSGFEPVRREIAAQTMKRLIADGRIHPARIEEVALKVREDMDKVMEETGKQVALELDIVNLKPREIMLLGRLKYRTSYGQNVLDHSRDVGFLSGMLAAQMGLNEGLARRCGLLHDIGKAVDHEHEGTHPELGAEVGKLCAEPPEVMDAILHHHTPGDANTIYATIVSAADAISAARPGARRETLENYVKRLERLEVIAGSYPGVEKCFAVQAGREVRVIANAQNMSDGDCQRICRQIAKQIEDELTYPGEVKVTMIREYRITEYAR